MAALCWLPGGRQREDVDRLVLGVAPKWLRALGFVGSEHQAVVICRVTGSAAWRIAWCQLLTTQSRAMTR